MLRTFEQIPIHRGEGDGAALDAALDALHAGAVIAIAPEGTVNTDPEHLQRIRSGVARLALPTGAPIVPVGIWGTQTRWPRGGIRWVRPWRPTVMISFGPPILPEGDVASEADIDVLRDRVRDRLEDRRDRAISRLAMTDGDRFRRNRCSRCPRRRSSRAYETFVLAFVLALIL